MSEKREWWIGFTGSPEYDKLMQKRTVSGKLFETVDFADEVVHVVEASALEDAQKEIAVLKESKADLEELLHFAKPILSGITVARLDGWNSDGTSRVTTEVYTTPEIERFRKALAEWEARG